MMRSQVLEDERCECTGCEECEPVRGPCARTMVNRSDRRCEECHERAADVAAEARFIYEGPEPPGRPR